MSDWAAPEPAPETAPSRRVVGRFLWSLFRGRLPHFAGALALLVVDSGLVVLGPLLVKHAIDADIAHRDLAGLRRTVLLYLGTQLLHIGLFYVMRNWLEWAGQSLMADLKRRVFRHLMTLPVAFYDRNPPGRLISRVENDTAALRQLFTTTSVMLLGDVLLFVGMLVAMALVSPRLTLVTSAVLPVLFVVSFWFQSRAHPLFVAARRFTAEICARLAEFIHGMPVIQAFSRQHWATREFQELNRAKYHVDVRGEALWLYWHNGVVLLQTLAFASILGLGGFWALSGLVTIGTLAMFIGYVRRFFEPLLRLSDQFATIQKAMAGAERLRGLLEEPATVVTAARPLPWPGLHTGLTLENVSFRYGPDTEWVLRDVSFTIPAGERWALVGPTGSGKTTIVSLLLRFYDPVEGRILVDGVDLRDLDPRDLRRRVGLVLQDLYLFPGDLEANLTLGRPARRDDLERAAALTLADHVVARLPGGYGAAVSERGQNLSAGERQLLSFTRAVLRDPELLILDEATSAVDPATEAGIEASLGRVLRGRTALVIAHRLSTVRRCDRILVLEGGRIVEQGNHGELLAANGLYRALHDLQWKEAAGAPVAS